jgi:replicative DNA helicase
MPTKAVMELKRISRDYNTPVFAISSLNRESYGKSINMTAFKESGAIEYSSDVLIGLQIAGIDNQSNDKAEEYINSEKNKEIRDIELKILKNRNGITGSRVQFKYNPKFNLFAEDKVSKVNPSSFPSKKK